MTNEETLAALHEIRGFMEEYFIDRRCSFERESGAPLSVGNCIVSSCVAAIILNALEGKMHWCVMTGGMRPSHKGHAFLMDVDRTIVADITADQFGLPAVIFVDQEQAVVLAYDIKEPLGETGTVSRQKRIAWLVEEWHTRDMACERAHALPCL